MTADQQKRFTEVLAGVHDFYGKDLSKFAAAVWLQACETLDVEQVTKALSAHLMDPERGQFMPKPADIVRQIQGTSSDRSLIAWGKVLDACARVGAYSSVCFDDGIIHAAVEDLGGWVSLCRSKTDELGYIQKRFCDAYKAYAGRSDLTFPAMLPGEHAITNSLKGFASQPPALIGDPEKAKRVLTSGASAPKTQITHVVATAMLALNREGDAA